MAIRKRTIKRRKRRSVRTSKVVVSEAGIEIRIGKSQFTALRRYQRMARRQGKQLTSKEYYELVSKRGLREANKELVKRYKPKRVKLTRKQAKVVSRLQKAAEKLGIKINKEEILQSKREFGWGRTRKSVEQSIRHKAGFAYYEYIHYLEKLIMDNNLDMPDTLSKLRNRRLYPYMTYDSLEQVHDKIYEVLKGYIGAPIADAICVGYINDGVQIGKEIAKFRL